MRSNWRIAGTALTLLPLLIASGCTGDAVIQPGNGRLELQIVVDPAVGPRGGSADPFKYATIDLAAVTFNAIDPLAQKVLGPYPLQILQQPTIAGMTSSQSQTLGTINMSAGTYVMDKVFMNGFDVNASLYCSVTTFTECRLDADCPSTETCSAVMPPLPIADGRCYQGNLESGHFLVAGSSSQKGVVPTTQPQFRIQPGKVTLLRVVMDGAALTTLLESHATCSTTSNVATLTQIAASELSPMVSVELP